MTRQSATFDDATLFADDSLPNGSRNRLLEQDRAAHDWYRFVLSFPPHLVRDYLQKFDLKPTQLVLDPFCGTGTTLVECKKRGVASAGIEANPMAALASEVKTDWGVDPDGLLRHAESVAAITAAQLERDGFHDNELAYCPFQGEVPGNLMALPPEAMKLLLAGSISPVPLHKTLLLLANIRKHADAAFLKPELLAIASSLVSETGNLHFGPEVGVTTPKRDAPVLGSWIRNVRTMAADLRRLNKQAGVKSRVIAGDSRILSRYFGPSSIDAVITSPPYPNEKDYTRTTRLESVILGLVRDKGELRALKKSLVRSNTRSVYVEDTDDSWIRDNAAVNAIAERIEARRIAMGKTSGFERQYHRVTRLYFGGMARHFAELRGILRPGAMLAYVVGDQASYLQVMIRTGEILAEIAGQLGYEVVGIDLFRTRLATATRKQLREEVVVLRWPG